MGPWAKTYLEMTSFDQFVPAPVPEHEELRLEECTERRQTVRSLQLEIGKPHNWPRARWDEKSWQHYLSQPSRRHWIAKLSGLEVGLLSLDFGPDGDVEIDTFGLLPEYVGRGLGGRFLTLGVRLAWTLDADVKRLHLSTTTNDHPHAIVNYKRRGFRTYGLNTNQSER